MSLSRLRARTALRQSEIVRADPPRCGSTRQALARKGRMIAYEYDRMKSKARHVSTRDRARPVLLIAYCALLSTLDEPRARQLRSGRKSRENDVRTAANPRISFLSFFFFKRFAFPRRTPLFQLPLPALSITYLGDCVAETAMGRAFGKLNFRLLRNSANDC